MSELSVMRLAIYILGLCVGLLAADRSLADEVRLAGEHAIHVGDDRPAFADPAYDDSGWDRIAVPSSLRSAGFGPRIDVFWYRIHFDAPADWSSNTPAIRLGIIDRADETYLNGVLIGGNGQIGPRQSDWHVYPPMLPRLYPFDPDLLAHGGRNVLAVRIAREPYIDDGGIIVGPVALVDMADALPEYLILRQRFLSINYILLGIETIIMLSAIFTLHLKPEHRSTWLFFLLYIFYYLQTLERRNVFHLAGLDHPAIQFAANVLGALAIPALIAFVAHVLGQSVGRLGRFVQIGSIAALISVPLTGVPLLDWWAIESNLVWHSLFLMGLILMVVWSVRALFRGQPHSIPLFLGLLALAASMFGDILLPANFVEAAFGFRLGEVGVLAFFLSMAFIAAANILQTDRALQRANTDVLTAHEQERARLARDVHDSIGQWLTTIKLRLELLGDGADGGRTGARGKVEELVSDVTHAIEDTRRVAQDLSPVFLEEQGLAAAMRTLAERAARRRDLSIDVDVPPAIDLPKTERDHLYRVFQEALNNAASHSEATRIVVTLERDRDQVVLAVSDNGRGMLNGRSPTQSNAANGGLGLKTMRDRARLLGGRLDVMSNDGGGTTVQLRFPS